MNEKIKQLTQQAGLEIATNSVGMPIIVATHEHKLADPATAINEFARLIVLECASIAREHTLVSSGVDPVNYTGVVTVSEKIKEHFGIN